MAVAGTGGRSFHCGTTVQLLMKAQCDVAGSGGKEEAEERAVDASISVSDCSRISVTLKFPAGSSPTAVRRLSFQSLLSEDEWSFRRILCAFSKALDCILFVFVGIEDREKSGHRK